MGERFNFNLQDMEPEEVDKVLEKHNIVLGAIFGFQIEKVKQGKDNVIMLHLLAEDDGNVWRTGQTFHAGWLDNFEELVKETQKELKKKKWSRHIKK